MNFGTRASTIVAYDSDLGRRLDIFRRRRRRRRLDPKTLVKLLPKDLVRIARDVDVKLSFSSNIWRAFLYLHATRNEYIPLRETIRMNIMLSKEN